MSIKHDFRSKQVQDPNDPTKKVTVDQRLLQGAAWVIPFRLSRFINGVKTPVNIATDVSEIRLQVRATIGAATTIIDATLTGGEFVATDGPAGEIEIRIPAAVTEAITDVGIKAPYDMEVVYALPIVEVKRLLEGTVDISAEVTR